MQQQCRHSAGHIIQEHQWQDKQPVGFCRHARKNSRNLTTSIALCSARYSPAHNTHRLPAPAAASNCSQQRARASATTRFAAAVVDLVPAGPALLGGAALEVLADARPAGAVLGMQLPQLGIFLSRPRILQAQQQQPKVAVNRQQSYSMSVLVVVRDRHCTTARCKPFPAPAFKAPLGTPSPMHVPLSRASACSDAVEQPWGASGFLLTLLMLGSRWRLQRPMHCWSVRPSQLRAISAQRPTPKVLTSSISFASSSAVHLSRLMLGLT